MLEVLRLWLNGNREYWSGVVLYAQCNLDERLLNVFKKAKTDFTTERLPKALLEKFNELNIDTNVITKNGEPTNTTTQKGCTTKRLGSLATTISTKTIIIATAKEAVNKVLYEACKLEADNLYKETMNLRAVLFNKAKPTGFEDINRPDLVQQRNKPSVDVVIMFQKASKLYDKAAYVYDHGRLPNEDLDHDPDTEMEALPDELVKSTLDNLRKNFNKMKKREATPERLAMLQKHEKNIIKLEARWHYLKPIK